MGVLRNASAIGFCLVSLVGAGVAGALQAPVLSSGGDQDRVEQVMRAIDALLATQSEGLEFVADFRIRSGWGDRLDADYDDAFFKSQVAPELEAGIGEVVVGRQAFRFRFQATSRVVYVGNFVSFGSGEIAQSERYRIHHFPVEVGANGMKAGEQCEVGRHSSGKKFDRASIVFGLSYCSVVVSGIAAGELFSSELQKRTLEFGVSNVPSRQGERLVVTGVAHQSLPYQIKWVFDLAGGFPQLLRIEEGDERIIELSEFRDLRSGGRIPLRLLQVSGPMLVEGKKRFNVKEFRFLRFEERAPKREEFSIKLTDPGCVRGYSLPEEATEINILELDEGRLRVPTDERRTGYLQQDESYSKSSAGDSRRIPIWQRYVLAVVISLLVAGLIVALAFRGKRWLPPNKRR